MAVSMAVGVRTRGRVLAAAGMGSERKQRTLVYRQWTVSLNAVKDEERSAMQRYREN